MTDHATSPHDTPGTTSRESAVDAIVGKVAEVAVLPQVVYRIMERAGGQQFCLKEMERTISVDPGFTAKVLALANSAHYALPRRVASIRDAIAFLGSKGVRELAMATAVFDMFLGKTDAESIRRRTWWRQSLDAAICAKWIAAHVPTADPEVAYTGGLLHYFGKTVLDRSNPAYYEKVMHVVSLGADDRQAERVVFGCDHIEVGQAISAKWGFPDQLCYALNYVDPPEMDQPGAETRAIIAIAHQIALHVLEGLPGQDEEPLPLWALITLGMRPGDARRIMEGASAAVTEARLAA